MDGSRTDENSIKVNITLYGYMYSVFVGFYTVFCS